MKTGELPPREKEEKSIGTDKVIRFEIDGMVHEKTVKESIEIADMILCIVRCAL